MRLSIIIPVFNAAGTIEKTLNSLAHQTFHDFEALIIDDGSSDGTLEKIQQFISDSASAKGPVFRLITIPHAGISDARNAGLDAADGEIIGFCDADDIVPEYAYDCMISCWDAFPNCQMVAGCYDRKDGFTVYKNYRSRKMAERPVVFPFDENLLYGVTLWNKFFSADIIRRAGLRFENYLHLEDGVFVYEYLDRIDRVVTCPRIIYHYMKPLPITYRTASQRCGIENVMSAVSAAEKVFNITRSWPDSSRRAVFMRMITGLLIGGYYRRFRELDPEAAEYTYNILTEWIAQLTDEEISYLVEKDTDLFIDGKLISPEKMASDPLIMIAVSPRCQDEKVLRTVSCLQGQELQNYALILPARFRGRFSEPGARFIEADTEHEFFRMSLECAGSEFITFMDVPAVYDRRLLKRMCRMLSENSGTDMLSPRTLFLRGSVARHSKIADLGFRMEYLPLDAVLSGKVFRTEALKQSGFRFSGDTALDAMEAFRLLPFERLRGEAVALDIKEKALISRAQRCAGRKGLPTNIRTGCEEIMKSTGQAMPPREGRLRYARKKLGRAFRRITGR